MKFFKDGRRALLAGVALTACMGFAFSAQAQTCTVSNWQGGATNLTDGDTGTQGASNRRYGGPCGLRVAVDGTARYVTDDSPQAEGTYIARFYTFLNNAGGNPVILFAADDGTDDQIQVWYNDPAGELTLRVFDNGGTPQDLSVPVGNGWHSVELVWEADAAAQVLFSVDGAADLSTSLDTSGLSIANAHLGNVNGAAGGGSLDFDDFDSRRIDRPGRLMVGDADDNGEVNTLDGLAILDEFNSGTYAAGQPDCDENGAINTLDALCALDIFFGN